MPKPRDATPPVRSRPGPASGPLPPEVVLFVGGLVLNFAWELLQTPLFTDADRTWRYLLWTRLHCTAGDVLVLLGAHALTALAVRDRHWGRRRGRRGFGPALMFVLLGLSYTAWSEWLNTTVTQAWAYTSRMPTVLGVGLAPLLQWLLLPPLLVALLRRRA